MYRLESEEIVLSLLPERGAKIVQLYFKPTGSELLSKPEADDGGGDFAPGIPFDAHQAWGWDEMFPAIQAGAFDSEGRHIIVPDHGEVWTLPWRVVETSGVSGITLMVLVPSTGYELTRTTMVTGSTVRHDYTLTNTGPMDLPWIWAAHPLFSLSDGATMRTPPVWRTVRNAYESPSMAGYDRLYPYPGSAPRLDLLPPPDSSIARKYYFEEPNRNPDAAVTLSLPSVGVDVHVQADPRVAPWYGVWCNAGGLFGHNNVAIEPASAPMDSLSAADRLGRLPSLPAGESVTWWMMVSVLPNG